MSSTAPSSLVPDAQAVTPRRVAAHVGISIAVQVCLVAVSLSVGRSGTRGHGALLLFAPSTLLLGGLYARWSSRWPRSLAYQLVIAAVAEVWMAYYVSLGRGWSLWGKTTGLLQPANNLFVVPSLRSLNLLIPTVWFAACVFAVWVTVGRGAREHQLARARRCYPAVIGGGPLVVASWLLTWLVVPATPAYALVVLYLVLRFYVGALLSSRPIVYLRSFHGDAAPRLFAEVIAPVVRRHGVLVGLDHQLQPSWKLHYRAGVTSTASLVAVPDASWQQTVLSQLSRCSAVILDVGQQTPGVLWELRTAGELLPSSCVVVLAPEGAELPAAGAVPLLRYPPPGSLSRTDRHKLRRALDQALRRSRAAPLGTRSSAGPAL